MLQLTLTSHEPVEGLIAGIVSRSAGLAEREPNLVPVCPLIQSHRCELSAPVALDRPGPAMANHKIAQHLGHMFPSKAPANLERQVFPREHVDHRLLPQRTVIKSRRSRKRGSEPFKTMRKQPEPVG